MTTRLVVFCSGLLSLSTFVSSPLWAATTDGTPVVVMKVEEQLIRRQVEITGSVTSPSTANLSSSISGLVTALHAEEGDQVKAGAVLVELDPELAKLQTQIAQAELQQAQTSLNDAKRRLGEAQRLAPKQSIAESVVRSLEAEVAVGQAATEQAKTQVSYQQALLARHSLKAPFTGVISRRLTNPGEWVSPGNGVYELVATEGLRLDFAVPEDYLADLHPDTKVSFRINALSGEKFSGRVTAIVPVTSPGARTFLLRVVPDQKDNRIIPGMSVSASLQMPTDRQSVVVPRDAILRYPDGRVTIWTAETDSKGTIAKEQQVQLGQSFAGEIEITSGLDTDAQVVVRGNEALQSGQRLNITETHSTDR